MTAGGDPVGSQTPALAIWLTTALVAVPRELATPGASFHLIGRPEIAISIDDLEPGEWGNNQRINEVDYRALRLADQQGSTLSRRLAADVLRGPLILEIACEGAVVSRSGIQIAPVLDVLYSKASRRQLGVTWCGASPQLRIWAPTATTVQLLLWRAGTAEESRYQARRDDDGVWTVEGGPDWEDAEYRWEIRVYAPSVGSMVTNQVTDPYSVGLTVDSRRSVIVDRRAQRWKPAGWDEHVVPAVGNPARQAIYELHVRDFSAWDYSISPDLRGTYRAFTELNSQGMRALRDLADAGLTTVHLLPTFDISSDVIPEDRRRQNQPSLRGPALGMEEETTASSRLRGSRDRDLLRARPSSEPIALLPHNLSALEELPGWSSSSTLPEQAVAAVANTDAFNWGYDPWHWMTPEGSYASEGNQVGGARTREYRQMVQSLHEVGLRVVQDVVFNHTFAHGQQRTSVLDKVVPGYYHRLCPRGQVETSTCCANIATEHRMAQKIMVDSLVDAAVYYRIDGFRFDLMGHHSVDNMKAVRQALDGLTLENDGVDGRQIYLYGEGWNFGEVADDALFIQATQRHIAGTGIGAFNDRLRDAVRGGSLMDADARSRQGFATGLLVDANSVQDQSAAGRRRARDEMFALMDLIKVSLVGAIKDYPVPRSDGKGTVWSQDVDYFGTGAAFANEPQECVNYVEAHDDTTLYDTGVWKLPLDTSMAERVRAQVLANSLVMLGQGVAFWAAGTELLRSKSLDRDSYNSGDWFNAIDWSGRWNHFGRGLPSAGRNRAHWSQMRPLLQREELRPQSEDMARCRELSMELLRLRASEPLLTLGRADEIRRRVLFLSTGLEDDKSTKDADRADTPGVVAMWISGEGIGDGHSRLVVFNAGTQVWCQNLRTPCGKLPVAVPARGLFTLAVAKTDR